MDARWMPLLAAAVGVLGGVGGAFIGGVVANEGQERQSQSERAAAIEDLRIDTYGDYLASSEALTGKLELNFSEDERDEALVQLVRIRARVVLVAEDREVMLQRANAITQAVVDNDEAAYDSAAENFVEAARDEVEDFGK